MAIDQHEPGRTHPRCLETKEMPGVFLRFQSPREQMALPYSCLLAIVMKVDGTALELAFVTHKVTVSGKSLAEVYAAVAEAQARVINVVSPQFNETARAPAFKSIVTGIRIEPIDPEANQKQ